MKRIVACFLMLFAFAACSGNNDAAKGAQNHQKAATTQLAQVSERKEVGQLEKGDTVTGKVMKVIDGDTLVVDSGEVREFFKCRLYGIDAPETPKPGQPYGEEAADALKKMVLGQQVEVTIMNQDQYHRQVCEIRKDNADINAWMIGQGYAWAYSQYLNKRMRRQYQALEAEARENHRGLWREQDPENPAHYRKRMKGKD